MTKFVAIHGEACPSCGRDNHEYGNLCTAEDCEGFAALSQADKDEAQTISNAAYED